MCLQTILLVPVSHCKNISSKRHKITQVIEYTLIAYTANKVVEQGAMLK